MEGVAIKVEGLHKSFKLPHEKSSSLKGAFVNVFRGKRSYETQKVLKSVSFEIKKGEFFGIVGRNGSGKSTLLKLLAGIYMPDKGTVQVNGKLTPFIELGVGFNPELTGRENVYLNGALLGFSRKEMDELYEEIVAFAELEKFMDQKLKNYSSGMQVRLAFSIAIRAKSDVLVLDEVLAVGDEAFQKKCIDVFEQYKSEHRTVVLVTHDMETIRRFCNKAILIDSGEIESEGSPQKVASEYSKANVKKEQADLKSQRVVNNLHIELLKSKSKNYIFDQDEEIGIQLSWKNPENRIVNPGFGIVKNTGEFIYGTNTISLKRNPNTNTNTALCKVRLSIGPGKYNVKGGLVGTHLQDVIDYVDNGPEFIIRDRPGEIHSGITRLKHNWELDE